MSESEQSILSCQQCGEALETDWENCPVCGTQTSSGAGLTCINCGRPVKERWRMCPSCKTSLLGYATPTAMDGASRSVPSGSSSDPGAQVFISMIGDDPSAKAEQPLTLPVTEGDILGDRYTVRGSLGMGGFGTVYRVYDTVTNEEIALKVVVAAEGEGKAERAVEQLLHEFKLRQKINDLTYIMKSGDPRPCDYKGLSLVLLPMELANDSNLRQWLAHNRDTDKRRKEGLEFFKNACLGVKAIHDAGLVHMDIKPENILRVDGKAKVTDFGIGRFAGMDFENNPDQLLHQGVGTPQYMSPEQFQTARQKDIGAASDIYSLGLVLYEILDGGLPFDGMPIELREKHLNMAPPCLKDGADRWWPIVEHCLAKKPDERYVNVEMLLKDLERVEQGAALSVNVSCQQCGHINSNANLRICQNCQASLGSLFRPCPQCAREVRLDVEICLGCGSEVLAYYVLQDRWQHVGALKDEDPVETIELLEVILRDGAGEFQERVVKLVRDLRQKQSQISGLITLAGKAVVDGEPRDALNAWQEVLKIIPRHQIAMDKIQELEALLARFDDLQAQALGLIDQSYFKQGEEHLKECLELIPARKEVKHCLDSCRERSRQYASAFDKAQSAHRNKLIVTASKHAKDALAEAPKSADALRLRSKLDKTGGLTEELLQKANKQLSQANFKEVETSIRKIEEIQADLDGISLIKAKLPETKATYQEAIDAVERAKKELALDTASKEAKKALKTCPNSSEADKLLKKIESDQTMARHLLKEACAATITAKFSEAETNVQEIDQLWPGVDGLLIAKENLITAREEYGKHIELARQAKSDKDLESAFSAVREAIEICSESEEALELAEAIEDDQSITLKHLEDAKSASLAAEFDKAGQELQLAKDLWETCEELHEMESDVEKKEQTYRSAISQARKDLKEKKFEKAKSVCSDALDACPDSSEAKILLDNILEAQKDDESKRELTKNRTIRCLKWVAVCTPLFIGLGLLLWSNLVSGSIAAITALLAAIVHWKKDTRLHDRIYMAFPIDSGGQAFCLLQGFLLLPSGILSCIILTQALHFGTYIFWAQVGTALLLPAPVLAYGVMGGNGLKMTGKWGLICTVTAVVLLCIGLGAVMLWQLIQTTIWPALEENTPLLMGAWAILLLLTAGIHFARYTNLYRNTFTGLFQRKGNNQFSAFIVVAICVAILCWLPALGVGWMGRNTFSMKGDGPFTLAVLTAIVTQGFALLHAVVCKCNWNRT